MAAQQTKEQIKADDTKRVQECLNYIKANPGKASWDWVHGVIDEAKALGIPKPDWFAAGMHPEAAFWENAVVVVRHNEATAFWENAILARQENSGMYD